MSKSKRYTTYLGFDSRDGRYMISTEYRREATGFVAPKELVEVYARPQIYFSGTKLCVWSGCADSFFIHSVRLGNMERSASPGAIPASAFATQLDMLPLVEAELAKTGTVIIEIKQSGSVIGQDFITPVISPGMEVKLLIENISDIPSRFMAVLFGESVE